MHYVQFWKVRSDSNPDKTHTVGLTDDRIYGCTCVGWTRHFPRRDCRHILYVKSGHGENYDPLLRSMTLTLAKEERKNQR